MPLPHFPHAATGIRPPCTVTLIGTLPKLSSPRALTHCALSQTVAPLTTVLGKAMSAVARVAAVERAGTILLALQTAALSAGHY